MQLFPILIPSFIYTLWKLDSAKVYCLMINFLKTLEKPSRREKSFENYHIFSKWKYFLNRSVLAYLHKTYYFKSFFILSRKLSLIHFQLSIFSLADLSQNFTLQNPLMCFFFLPLATIRVFCPAAKVTLVCGFFFWPRLDIEYAKTGKRCIPRCSRASISLSFNVWLRVNMNENPVLLSYIYVWIHAIRFPWWPLSRAHEGNKEEKKKRKCAECKLYRSVCISYW